MDWASVVSIAITGVVGIAGVAGAIVSARMASKSATKDLKLSISAENERARLARKQQVYAAFYDAVSRISKLHPSASEDDDSDISDAIHLLFTTTADITLLAPVHVCKLAVEVGDIKMAQAEAMRGGAEPKPSDYRGKLGNLLEAMRADLGEPVGPVEE